MVDDIIQRVSIQGDDQVVAALNRIATAGERSFAQVQASAGKLDVSKPFNNVAQAAGNVGNAVGGASQAIGQTAAKFEDAGKSVGGFVQAAEGAGKSTANLAQIGGGLAQAFSAFSNQSVAAGHALAGTYQSVAGLTDGIGSLLLKISLVSAAVIGIPAAFSAMSNAAADAAHNIHEAAIQAGTSAENYQAMILASKELGTDSEKLDQALRIIGDTQGQINDAMQQAAIATEKFRNSQADAAEDFDRQESAKRLASQNSTVAIGSNMQQLLTKMHEVQAFNKQQTQASTEFWSQQVVQSRRFLRDQGLEMENTSKAWHQYGISLVDAAGHARDTVDVLKDVADVISRYSNSSDRLAVVTQLLTRRIGPGLLPILEQGRKGIEDLAAAGKLAGLQMSTEMIEVGDKFRRARGLMGAQISALRNQLGLIFGPALTEAMDAFTQGLQESGSSVKDLATAIATQARPYIVDFARLISGQQTKTTIFGVAREAVLVFAGAVKLAFNGVIIPAFKALELALTGIAKTINTVFGSKLTAEDVGVYIVTALLINKFLTVINVVGLVGGAFRVLLGIFRSVLGPFGNLTEFALALWRGLTGLPGLIARLVGNFISWGAGILRVVAVVASLTTGLGLIPVVIGVAIAAGIAFFAVWAWNHWAEIVQFAERMKRGVVVIVGGIWGLIKAAWDNGIQWISGFFSKIGSLAGSAWQFIKDQGANLINDLVGLWTSGVNGINQLWEEIKNAVNNVWEEIKQGASNLWESISSAWNDGIEKIKGWLRSLRDFAIGVFSAVADAAKQASDAGVAGAASPAGMASGGMIRGRGTSTSDSIPIWASNNEFIVRAAAVRKYGSSLLHAINSMRFDADGLRHFALGGLVSSMQVNVPKMSFAGGGLVSSAATRAINLTIGADTFSGLMAPEAVAQKLMRVATARQLRSGGRKPSYYGGGK